MIATALPAMPDQIFLYIALIAEIDEVLAQITEILERKDG